MTSWPISKIVIRPSEFWLIALNIIIINELDMEFLVASSFFISSAKWEVLLVFEEFDARYLGCGRSIKFRMNTYMGERKPLTGSTVVVMYEHKPLRLSYVRPCFVSGSSPLFLSLILYRSLLPPAFGISVKTLFPHSIILHNQALFITLSCINNRMVYATRLYHYNLMV